MRRFFILATTTTSMCLALAGCFNGEPSEPQMRAAFDSLMRADGNEKSFSLNEFKKLACKVSGDRSGYVCDFFADASASLDTLGPQKIHRNISGRFVAGQHNQLQFIPEQWG